MEGQQVIEEQPGQEERREPQARRQRVHSPAEALPVHLTESPARPPRETAGALRAGWVDRIRDLLVGGFVFERAAEVMVQDAVDSGGGAAPRDLAPPEDAALVSHAQSLVDQ